MIMAGIILVIISVGLTLFGDGITGAMVDMAGAGIAGADGTDGTDGTIGVTLDGDGTHGDGTDMA